jgi:hypothetical protein
MAKNKNKQAKNDVEFAQEVAGNNQQQKQKPNQQNKY